MMEIELTRGKVAIIDDEDWPLVAGFKWTAYKRGRVWYAQTNVPREDGRRTTVKMHRLILGLTDPGVHVDHWDCDGLNNRRKNLRRATRFENMRNQAEHSNNTSGYKGVTWNKQSGRWVAQIMANRKQMHIGYFDDPAEAHAAYCKAAAKLHGDFANFGRHETIENVNPSTHP